MGNPNCKLSENPQYALTVHRPTEFKFSVSQVDPNGLAAPECNPAAMYVCRSESRTRALRVHELDCNNVMCDTGSPRSDRMLHAYVTLEPGSYVIMLACYMSGMEGPFQLQVMSNHEATLEQLWPPPWRGNKEPTTFMEKLQAKAIAKMEEGIDVMAAKAEELESKVNAELGIFKDDGVTIPKAHPNSPWVAKRDGDGKLFYHNKETKESVFERPPDFDWVPDKKPWRRFFFFP